jgi:hypothetical protein
MAAAPELPDIDVLTRERVVLQADKRLLERELARLQDRLGAFPNDLTAQQERRVSAELVLVNQRIDEIDATLVPYRLGR